MLIELLKYFFRITAYNFMQINIITPNYAYYNTIELKHRYLYSMTLILHKTQVRCIKNCYLNKLFDFFRIFGRINTHNFVKINVITLNYAYCKIVQLTLRYEYHTTLIFHKT
jgi:hypothetical protein